MTGIPPTRPVIAFHARMPTAAEHGLAGPPPVRSYLVAYAADRFIIRCRLNALRMEEQLHAAFGPEAAHTLAERGGDSLFVLIHPADIVVAAAETLVDLARSGWIRPGDRAHTVAPRMQDLWSSMTLSDRLELIGQCDVEDVGLALAAQFPPEVEYWLEGLVEHL